MLDSSGQIDEASSGASSTDTSFILKLYQDNEIDRLKEYIETSKTNNTLNTQDLIDLAKSNKDAATLVKELINTIHVDETELADMIAKEIIRDIGDFVDNHLEKYHKYALDAPQVTSNVDNVWKAKFFNLISLLKDVSILGRKLLEASPRFESCKPRSPQISNLNLIDRKFITAGNLQKDSKSQISDDATSDDLLAALIESSSSDDFLVLSSSLDSITVKDMILASLILITSHECFTLSHDIQGVVVVLRRTKFLIKNILAPKNQMELVTKLLTSISRYNEMKYVFDLFRDRNQFEMLLSKGVEKTPELRIALFNYVKKNPEFYALVTLNFSMFREIAESLEASAEKRLDKMIQSRKSKKKRTSTPVTTAVGLCDDSSNLTTPNLCVGNKQQHESNDSKERELSTSSSLNKTNSIAASLSNLTSGSSSNTNTQSHDSNSKPLYSKDSLNLCLVEMVDASDCFAKAGCYKRSISCEHRAKLIALQLALLPSGINVIDLQQSELSDVIVSFESFPDAYIVAEAYNHHLAWRQAIFRNVLLLGQLSYLNDFCMKCDLSSALIIELVFLYKQHVANLTNQLSNDEATSMANFMKLILARLSDVELKCKLYNQLSFNDSKEELLQNPSIHAHLKDLKLA